MEVLKGFIQYNCPHCDGVNTIPLENLEDYIDIENVPIRYQEHDHTHNIEFYAPICKACGKTFSSFLKVSW